MGKQTHWSWPWTGILQDLVEARGSELQLAQYIAVLAGIRKSLDDWVPAPRLETYHRALKKIGLHVEIDCLFRPLPETSHVWGADAVPTTRAVGMEYRAEAEPDSATTVHVIVSSRADWAGEALAAAWYSVAVEDRIVRKPLIDHVRFGHALGYPDCCVQFFMNHNDWPRMNTLSETLKNSTRICWETNSFPKHTVWMSVFHIPCAFDCAATRSHATAVLAAVRDVDRRYAEHIELFMHHPVLVVSEVLCYALVGGRLTATGRVAYQQAIYLGGERRSDAYTRSLANGDEVAVSDGTIFIWRGNRLTRTLETRCDRGIIQVPLLLIFE